MVVLNEVTNMFWGITCDGGKRYTQTVEHSFHMSMAALEPRDIDGKPSKLGPVSVMIHHEKAEFLLCSLDDRIRQQSLNINFTEGEEVTFFLNGKGTVHLTGYLLKDSAYDRDIEDDSLCMHEDFDSDSTSEEDDGVNEDVGVPILTFPLEDDSEDEDYSPNKKRKKGPEAIMPSKKTKHSDDTPSGMTVYMDDSDSDSDDSDESNDIDLGFDGPNFDEDSDDDDEEDEDDDDDDDEEAYEEDDSDGEEMDTDALEKIVLQMQKNLPKEMSSKLGKKSKGRTSAQPETADSAKKEQAQKKTPKSGQGDVATSPAPKPDQKPAPNGTESTGKKKKKGNKVVKAAVVSTPSGKKGNDVSRPNTPAVSQVVTAAAVSTPSGKKGNDVSRPNTPAVSQAVKTPAETPKTGKKQKKAKSKPNTPANETEKPVKPVKCFLAGGTTVEVLKEGTGQEAKTGKMMHVYYTGMLKGSGKVFDSVSSGKPFKFKLGKGEVIKGWDLGCEGMKVGGKRKVVVPPIHGYGSQRTGPIPPNSTLIFEVELKSIS